MNRPRQITAQLFLLLSLLILTVGCGIIGGTPRFGSEEEPLSTTDPAYIVCTAACAAQAQCGNLPDGATAVMLNTAGPATRNHNVLLGNNQQVGITEVRAATTVLESNLADTSQLWFYNITYAIEGSSSGSGWVAGWCISNQALDS